MVLTMRQILNNLANEDIKTDSKHLTYFYLLDYIKANCKINIIEIPSNIRLEYIGDFYGLLTNQNTNRKLLYINTLLNGLESSSEYDGMLSTIKYINTDDSKTSAIIERLNITQ